ncbi:MAG TPA: hypothetical protein VKV19_14365 [Ktedonobacteraceae bacterium]|nr:hypothetical protein [Ktedonobacteraceae bacterium]
MPGIVKKGRKLREEIIQGDESRPLPVAPVIGQREEHADVRVQFPEMLARRGAGE